MKGGTAAMPATHSNYKRRGYLTADMAAFSRLMAQDNAEELSHVKQNLVIALREDVTPRQRQTLLLYYSEGLTMGEIGARLGIDRSTVSRTIKRGEARLRRCLRYGAAAFLQQKD